MYRPRETLGDCCLAQLADERNARRYRRPPGCERPRFGGAKVSMASRTLLIAEIPHLRRYARALLRDPEAADDLVQSCLERSLSRFHLWQPHRPLRPWLFTIMHNLYVNLVRRRSSGPSFVPLDQSIAPPSQAASQETSAEVQIVMTAVDRLPEEQRSGILLVALEELTYSEAAKVLGIPPGTLMSRLHRGRERLRDLLRLDQQEPAIKQVK